MIESRLIFERLPANNLKVEGYSVSSAGDVANNNLAVYFGGHRHSNVAQAVDRLRAHIAAGKRRIGISGHGIDGYVETGAGNMGSSDADQWISRYTQSRWAPYIERLFGQNFDDFLIYSCSTGAGVSGAYLLWLLARHMEKPVYARTGLLYIVRQGKKYWLETEKGATWQVATGDMLSPPDPISSPSFLPLWKNLQYSLELVKDGKLVSVPLSGVESAEVSAGEREKRLVTGIQLGGLLEQLFASQAIEMPGDLLGTVTARLVLQISGEPLELEVYCDRAAIVVGASVMYYVGEGFREVLAALLA